MIVAELPIGELERRLRRGDLLLDLHPFVARIQSNIAALARDISTAYADFPICSTEAFADFHVAVRREFSLQLGFGWVSRFYFDGVPSFVPLTIAQAFAMLEWGLNWCVAAHAHRYLIFHAAVVEKNGYAAVLPAPPGSGKSTLCAGLVLRGWRLLTDELALFDMDSGLIHGMSRPINLKNASIDVIRGFEPQVVITREAPNTAKGTVALLRPPNQSVASRREPARPSCVILPRYSPGAAATLEPRSKARTFMLLAEQSFNYDLHEQQGFRAVEKLVDRVDCYGFTYSKLEEAVEVFDRLASEPRL